MTAPAPQAIAPLKLMRTSMQALIEIYGVTCYGIDMMISKWRREAFCMAKRPLGIGVENYKRLLEKPYYYVDKTLMVKDLLDKGGSVNLFTRPRRFGKTLALSMIKTFFEMEFDGGGNVIDNRHYFDGMKIMEAGDEYLRHTGRYPVISMSLKSARQANYHAAYTLLCRQIAGEFDRHKYVLQGNALSKEEKRRYQAILDLKKDETLYLDALKFLSDCLQKYHGENVIILIDEYDVPLENAFFRGFYGQMIDFVRSLFESALKTNDCLQFAVVTGCLRVSRESIFTGLNNLKINSILDNGFAEYFGFTQFEVENMLGYYGLSEKVQEAKTWYDGYLFGDTEVYNPWSIINYVDTAVGNSNAFPRPYWSNTSSNGIVRELIERADGLAKDELEELIAGRTIEKPIHEDITYGEIYDKQDNLWNFLFFTGYLKAVSQRFEGNKIYLTMTLPNEEVKYVYENKIQEWFDENVRKADFAPFYQAMREQDTQKMEEFINGQLNFSISFHDEGERFYHGYLLGILGGFGGCKILSNREQGTGRPDIILRPNNPHHPAFVIEIKRVKNFAKQDKACDEALRQIENRGYATELLHDGYDKVICYGICFCDKYCVIKT